MTPVAASGTSLGGIILDRRALSSLEQRTLERGAQVAAGLILNDRAVTAAEQRVRGEILEGLLAKDPVSLATVRRRADLLHLDLQQSHVVIAIAVEQADLPTVAEVARWQAAAKGGLAGVHDG